MKDLSKNIKECEWLPYEGYVWNSYKHVPTDSYPYLSRQLAKCIMRFNLHVFPVRTQMTSTKNIPNSQVYSLDERK